MLNFGKREREKRRTRKRLLFSRLIKTKEKVFIFKLDYSKIYFLLKKGEKTYFSLLLILI